MKVICKEDFKISIFGENVELLLDEEKFSECTVSIYIKKIDDSIVEKIPYQRKICFKFIFRESGFYYFRIFSKKNENTVIYNTPAFLFPEGEELLESSFLMSRIVGGEFNLLNDFFLHPRFDFEKSFHVVMDATHRGLNWDKSAFISSVLERLHDNLNDKKILFMLYAIIYSSDESVIVNNYKILGDFLRGYDNLSRCDFIFLSGLLEYRAGNYLNAENFFQELLDFDDLKNYQAAAPVYFYKWKPIVTKDISGDFNIIKFCNVPCDGVVLISCDYGYYMAYFNKSINSLIEKNTCTHVHLVLPRGFNFDNLNYCNSDYLGLSYEFEPEDLVGSKHMKTYYASVRYIILDKILQLYKAPVIVADIDLDFSVANCGQLFSKIADDELALVFSEKNIPWLKILAGFNLFGRDSYKNFFLVYLKQFLQFCFLTGRGGWMLDQVALEVAFNNMNNSEKSKIRHMSRIKSFPIKQYGDVAFYRSAAKQARISLKSS